MTTCGEAEDMVDVVMGADRRLFFLVGLLLFYNFSSLKTHLADDHQPGEV